jgi:hypothetical protein
MRRGVLTAALLAVAFFPVPGLVSSQQAATCHGCRAQPVNAQRWVVPLQGQWVAGNGASGTVAASGQAYLAVGGAVAAVGYGLTVSGYGLRDGVPLWQVTLAEPAGSAIISVRAWPGVVTAGVAGRAGKARTEVVIDATTGTVLRRYTAATFGGAVAASPAATVVIGGTSVTSYDNRTGRVRWHRPTGVGQTWRVEAGVLFVTESAGSLGSAPVTGLRVINLASGTERTLRSPSGSSFAGTLAAAAEGVVEFTSQTGVTGYDGITGDALWTIRGAVPEGSDPARHLLYLTSASGTLVGVDPLTGTVSASVSGSTAGAAAGMYVVRGGVVLGIDSGQGGEAWGYDVAAGRVTWTAPGLPWPHYFADLSGLGGSAAETGDIVIIAACPHLAGPAGPAATGSPGPSGAASPPATQTASPSGAASTSPAQSSSPAQQSSSPVQSPSPVQTPNPVQLCADPELVALNI